MAAGGQPATCPPGGGGSPSGRVASTSCGVDVGRDAGRACGSGHDHPGARRPVDVPPQPVEQRHQLAAEPDDQVHQVQAEPGQPADGAPIGWPPGPAGSTARRDRRAPPRRLPPPAPPDARGATGPFPRPPGRCVRVPWAARRPPRQPPSPRQPTPPPKPGCARRCAGGRSGAPRRRRRRRGARPRRADSSVANSWLRRRRASDSTYSGNACSAAPSTSK